jgi:WbqC-like protein family
VPEHRVVAIHQPNFFPWLGYFDKIARADVFVVLDDVQFSKTGGSWTNRARLLENGRPAWKTVPVRRAAQGLQPIRSVVMDEAPWRSKLLSFLRTYYGAAPAFGDVMPFVAELVEYPATRLCDFNINAIERLLTRLGLERTRLVRQSELAAGGHATELLVNLVRAAGGTEYLSGDGSDGYLDAGAFARAGLALRFQGFTQQAYPQRGVTEFVGGLSIVDALMHCGFDRVRELLQ